MDSGAGPEDVVKGEMQALPEPDLSRPIGNLELH
jgi:hypothetical protein